MPKGQIVKLQRQAGSAVSQTAWIPSMDTRSDAPIEPNDTAPDTTSATLVMASRSFIPPGEILGRKFRVGRVIGRGGASVVYEAEHAQLGQPVAIKVLSGRAGSADLKRALAEAKTTARLTGEHLVRVLDVGTTPSGRAYFVMDRLVGHDLERELRGGAFSIARAVAIIVQTCGALAGVHAAGIVHRDIKPSNLFLETRADGTALVKLLDFGLARDSESPEPQTAKPFCMVGSPGYAAPEQLMSRNVDARADIWALGAVLYRMLSGRKPFEVANLLDTLLAARHCPVPRMVGAHEPIPAGLEAVVLKCLAPNREDRFGSVRELAAALAPFGPQKSADSPPHRRERQLSQTEIRRPNKEAGTPALVLAPALPDRRRALSFVLASVATRLLGLDGSKLNPPPSGSPTKKDR